MSASRPRIRRCLGAFLLASALGAVSAGTVLAGGDPGAERARVVQKALERTGGGRVLAAEPRERDGRRLYRVKVLTPDGRVRVLWIEP